MNGPELRAHRLALGLTVRELADAIKTNRQTIYRWEHGERRIPGPVEVLILLMAGRFSPQQSKG